MTNPKGKRIYTTLQQTEDKFSFKARYAGRYQFCLTLSNGNGLGVALGSGNRCGRCAGLKEHQPEPPARVLGLFEGAPTP